MMLYTTCNIPFHGKASWSHPIDTLRCEQLLTPRNYQAGDLLQWNCLRLWQVLRSCRRTWQRRRKADQLARLALVHQCLRFGELSRLTSTICVYQIKLTWAWAGAAQVQHCWACWCHDLHVVPRKNAHTALIALDHVSIPPKVENVYMI